MISKVKDSKQQLSTLPKKHIKVTWISELSGLECINFWSGYFWIHR